MENRITAGQSKMDAEVHGNGRAQIMLASPRESGGSDGNPAKSTQGRRGEDESTHENQQTIYGKGQTWPNTAHSLRSLAQRGEYK